MIIYIEKIIIIITFVIDVINEGQHIIIIIISKIILIYILKAITDNKIINILIFCFHEKQNKINYKFI